MKVSNKVVAILCVLLRDPFLWWAVIFMIGITQIAASLPLNVLSLNPVLQEFCDFSGAWIPWIPKAAETFNNFPQLASLLLSVLWISFPVQIVVILWMFSKSPILKAESVPWTLKYPVRFPVGLFAVFTIWFFLMIKTDAQVLARLTGWRPSAFLSQMPNNPGSFGFGIGFEFLVGSMLAGVFLRSVLLAARNFKN